MPPKKKKTTANAPTEKKEQTFEEQIEEFRRKMRVTIYRSRTSLEDSDEPLLVTHLTKVTKAENRGIKGFLLWTETGHKFFTDYFGVDFDGNELIFEPEIEILKEVTDGLLVEVGPDDPPTIIEKGWVMHPWRAEDAKELVRKQHIEALTHHLAEMSHLIPKAIPALDLVNLAYLSKQFRNLLVDVRDAAEEMSLR